MTAVETRREVARLRARTAVLTAETATRRALPDPVRDALVAATAAAIDATAEAERTHALAVVDRIIDWLDPIVDEDDYGRPNTAMAVQQQLREAADEFRREM